MTSETRERSALVSRLNELAYEVRENPGLDIGALADELATLADQAAELRATPASAGGEVREQVKQAVGHGIEDAWKCYNRIYEPHDPEDESRQTWVDCITEQVCSALRSAPSEKKGGPILLYDSIGTGWVTPDHPLHSDHDRSAPSGVEEGEPVAWQIIDRQTGRSMVVDQDPRNPPDGRATGVTMFPDLYEAVPLYRAARLREGGGE